MPKKVAAKPTKKTGSVRVPVLCSSEQHARYLKAAEILGGIELAPLFRQALEEKIRRDALV